MASDHGGFGVKEQVKRILEDKKLAYKDLGPFSRRPTDDYPDFVLPLAEIVADQKGRGIISCRNGEGAAIAANKVIGIRAAVCWNQESARTARTDDDTNVLSLPADYLTPADIELIVEAWLNTPFSQDARHLRRIEKISRYEKEKDLKR